MATKEKSGLNGDLIRKPVKIYWAVIANYGRSCPEGYLSVYSCDTEEEAKQLLVMTSPKTNTGWVALELVENQTLENLAKFQRRLELADKFRKAKGKTKEKIRKQFMQAQLAARGIQCERWLCIVTIRPSKLCMKTSNTSFGLRTIRSWQSHRLQTQQPERIATSIGRGNVFAGSRILVVHQPKG